MDLRANLIEVDGIQVVPNEDARDPRLDPLDLRGLVQLVLLDVTDADDAPLRELVTRYRPSGPRERWSSKRTQGARRIILVTRGRVDVELEAYGYRSQQLTSIAGEHRVVMQRGYPVRIVLAGGLPQLANGLEILIRVTNPGRDGQDIFGGPKPVDAAGELAFEAARTATYAAQAYVRRRADGKEHLIGIGQTDPSQLQVVDSSAEQVFVLALDGERLESALRTLAKD